jgi:hypothetical protein
MVGPGNEVATAAVTARRDRAIPLPKSEILNLLVAEGRLDAAEQQRFRRFARLLGAVFHYEYLDELEKLRETYFYFNPDRPPPAHVGRAQLETGYATLTREFVRVLTGANFVEVAPEEIARAHTESAMVRVKIKTPLDEFRAIRVFRRGVHEETIDEPIWFGLRTRPRAVEVYDDVVLWAAVKPAADGEVLDGKVLDGKVLDGKVLPRQRRHRKGTIRPGAVLLKYFRHVASADLNALFPNARVVMSLTDQLKLGVPAVVGGVPILIKLASTVTVLFLVLGAYLGVSGTLHDDDLKQALAALSGVAALGAFMLRQWGNFHRESLKHEKQLTDNIYFRNLNNNVGIFDYLVGEAEDQQWKEALLSYYVLLTEAAPLAREGLDARIEAMLKQACGAAVDFEIDDALDKLTRLDLVVAHDGLLSAPPLAEALKRLDAVWDDYFSVEGVERRRL